MSDTGAVSTDLLPLRVTVLPPDPDDQVPHLQGYVGEELVVTAIDRHCSPTDGCFWVEVRLPDGAVDKLGDDVRAFREGEARYVPSDRLAPCDISMVPKTHAGSRVLINAWVFATARNDAHYRGPPRDLDGYEETYGVPWKDERIFDVGCRL